MPDTPEAYTHRIGRTGRAERTGEAYTMVTSEDEADVRAVERLLGQRIQRRTLPGFDYAARPASADEFARGPRPQRSQPKQRQSQPVPQGAPRAAVHQTPAQGQAMPRNDGQPHGQGQRGPAAPAQPRSQTGTRSQPNLTPQRSGSGVSRGR
jgi:superfamily II DNA/RNA helicase